MRNLKIGSRKVINCIIKEDKLELFKYMQSLNLEKFDKNIDLEFANKNNSIAEFIFESYLKKSIL
jgi:hypothetical protein